MKAKSGKKKHSILDRLTSAPEHSTPSAHTPDIDAMVVRESNRLQQLNLRPDQIADHLGHFRQDLNHSLRKT